MVWTDYGVLKKEVANTATTQETHIGPTSMHSTDTLGIYLAMLIFVYFTLNRKFVMLSDKWIAAMFLYVYIIAACFAESFLTNDTSVLYALALSVILGQPNKRRHHSLIRKQKDGTHTKFKLNHDR